MIALLTGVATGILAILIGFSVTEWRYWAVVGVGIMNLCVGLFLGGAMT